MVSRPYPYEGSRSCEQPPGYRDVDAGSGSGICGGCGNPGIADRLGEEMRNGGDQYGDGGDHRSVCGQPAWSLSGPGAEIQHRQYDEYAEPEHRDAEPRPARGFEAVEHLSLKFSVQRSIGPSTPSAHLPGVRSPREEDPDHRRNPSDERQQQGEAFVHGDRSEHLDVLMFDDGRFLGFRHQDFRISPVFPSQLDPLQEVGGFASLALRHPVENHCHEEEGQTTRCSESYVLVVDSPETAAVLDHWSP